MLIEYYINNSDPKAEKSLLSLWTRFCLKSPPLIIFEEQKTLSDKVSAIRDYYYEYFSGNLCFYEKNKGFAVFGEGEKWLDNSIPQFRGKRIAVMIMGASLNSDLSGAKYCMRMLKECFRRLKEEKGFDVIAWNVNRNIKKKGFQRIMNSLGGTKIEDCWYV